MSLINIEIVMTYIKTLASSCVVLLCSVAFATDKQTHQIDCSEGEVAQYIGDRWVCADQNTTGSESGVELIAKAEGVNSLREKLAFESEEHLACRR